jgi:penicillin amidase
MHNVFTAGVLAAVCGMAWPCAAEDVEIIRDTWGIPHVFAATDEGAMFGAGYATAADRLYQMHRHRMAYQGRLAELEGLRGNPGKTTVDEDKRIRKLRLYENCIRVADGLDAGTRALLDAYAAGVNEYIGEHVGQLDPLFHGVTPERWTAADCLACWDHPAAFFGLKVDGGESERLHELEAAGSCMAYHALNPSYAVIDEDAAVVQEDELLPGEKDALCAFAASVGYPCGSGAAPGLRATDQESPQFSHAWVVGGEALDSGSTALVSMPQLGVTSPGFFYEIHVKGATFDARGYGFPGAPGFLVGFSAGVAWGATALSIDTADTFRLEMLDADTYVYDNAPYDVQSETQSILIRQNDGTYTSEDVVVAWTERHGPIVTDMMNDVQPGEQYAIRAAIYRDVESHSVRAALGMMRAGTAQEFFDAAEHWRMPNVHSVFGDSTGAIGYTSLAAIPVRSAQTHCLGGAASQDGSSSAYDWQGLIPSVFRPHVLKPDGGALFSGNHIPVGTWYPFPLHLGTGGTGDGARSWRLRERLDLTAQPVLTTARVLGIRRDTVNPVDREVVRAGLHLLDFPGSGAQLGASAAQNLGIIEPWYDDGAIAQLDQPLHAGAFHMDTSFRYQNVPTPALVEIWGGNNICHWLKDVKARLDAFEAGGPLPSFSDDEVIFIDNALAVGLATANGEYGSPAGWQSGMAADFGSETVDYMALGLDGLPPLDPSKSVTYGLFNAPFGATIRSQRSAAAVMFANLAGVDRSQSHMPTGQSEDDASPHFADQADEWVAGTLRAAPLSHSAVLAIQESSQTVQYPPQ